MSSSGQTEMVSQLSLDGFQLAHPYESESFLGAEDGKIVRKVSLHDGSVAFSSLPNLAKQANQRTSLADEYDLSWLVSPDWPDATLSDARPLRVADLFSGCGGLSLGFAEACRALGRVCDFAFASDIDPVALDVYNRNFQPVLAEGRPIQELVNAPPGAAVSSEERALGRAIGDLDVVLAGPPCQGHSDLNNRTRRDDPKNQLILRVTRLAELLRPSLVIIEHVQGIRHDRSGAYLAAKDHLDALGYSLDEALLEADCLGVPQGRRRYFLVASTENVKPLATLRRQTMVRRPLGWAIDDLLEVDREEVFDTSSNHSEENKRRIDYLFDNDLFELPDAERPVCHQGGGHSYQSVYGRMYWDRPAPTITTGFGSTGQGRFVHPLRRRTLTPHEAARVQFFPDYFDFGSLGRRQYQSLIGNAVPSKLAYAIVLHQLR